MIVIRASLAPVLAERSTSAFDTAGRGEEWGAPPRIGCQLGRREDEAVADDGEGVLD